MICVDGARLLMRHYKAERNLRAVCHVAFTLPLSRVKVPLCCKPVNRKRMVFLVGVAALPCCLVFVAAEYQFQGRQTISEGSRFSLV